MNTRFLWVVLTSVFFVSGCENMMKTMVAHINLTEQGTRLLAEVNAKVNLCLAEKLVDRREAYKFSVTGAEALDLFVFQGNVYKTHYEETLNMGVAMKQENLPLFTSHCKKLDRELPSITEGLNGQINAGTQRLGRMRAEENRQILQNMNSFSANMRSYSYEVPLPKFQYRNETPATQNYLVNTSSGLRQCRVTSNSYVFCF